MSAHRLVVMGPGGPISLDMADFPNPMADPFEAMADSLVESISVEARRYGDMPGIYVWFDIPPEFMAEGGPSRPHAVALAEYGPNFATQLNVYPNHGSSRPDRHVASDGLAGWLSGYALTSLLASILGDRAMKVFTRRETEIRSRVQAGILDVLPRAGFSEAFEEALHLSAGWICYDREHRHLFADNDDGRRLRRFARRHPLLADLFLDEALRQPGHADVDPILIHPGLTQARLARLDALHATGWHGRAEQASETVLAFDLPMDFARFLAQVPVDWFPRDARQVDGFLFVARVASRLGKLVYRMPGWLSSCKGDWAGFAERCRRAYPEGDEGIRSHLHDPARALANALVVPVMALATDGRMSMLADFNPLFANIGARLIYRGKSLPACLEAATWWHAHLAEIRAAMPADLPAGERWAPLIPETRIGDLVLVPLVTPDDLAEEGSKHPDRNGVPGLCHCVATYGPRAMAGQTHIASLRRILPDGSYLRLATIEFHQTRDGTVLPHQTQGPGAEEAVAFVDELLRSQPHRPYIEPRCMAGDHGDIRRVCGYDWSDRDKVVQAAKAYGHLLESSLRGDLDRLTRFIGDAAEAERLLEAGT